MIVFSTPQLNIGNRFAWISNLFSRSYHISLIHPLSPLSERKFCFVGGWKWKQTIELQEKKSQRFEQTFKWKIRFFRWSGRKKISEKCENFSPTQISFLPRKKHISNALKSHSIHWFRRFLYLTLNNSGGSGSREEYQLRAW